MKLKIMKLKDIDDAIQYLFELDIKKKSKKGKLPLLRQIFYYLSDKHLTVNTRNIGEYMSMNRSGVFIQLNKFKDRLFLNRGFKTEKEMLFRLENYLIENHNISKSYNEYKILTDYDKHELILELKKANKKIKSLSNKNYRMRSENNYYKNKYKKLVELKIVA